MGTSAERRRRKKHKYEKLENISKTLLFSLLGSDVSRRSRKRSRSRSSSASESRKTSRHKHRKSRSRREERKSRKFRLDIKQEKLDTSNEVSEISAAPTEIAEIEVIDLDDIPLPESPRKNVKPKEEPSEKSQNDPKSMEIVSAENIAAPDASQEMNSLPVATQSENAAQTSQVLQNKPQEESVATICSKLVESWQSILHQGLSSQANEELLKKYRLTDDAQAFKAPTLNLPIKSLLSGTEIVRDEIEMGKQNQFGALIGAIEKGIYLIVNSQKRCSGLAKVVETMNDAASFIAQLHYSVSLQRRMHIAQVIGVIKMEIAASVADRLFSEEEEQEMQKWVTELIELSIRDEDIEKRLRAREAAEAEKEAAEAKKQAEEEAKKKAEEEAKKKAEEEAKKIAEEVAKKMAEAETAKMAEEGRKMAEEQKAAEQPAETEEEEEEEETPCSQRFATSRHSGRTLFKAKIEGVRGVKSEGKVKSEKGATPQFVPNSDFPGMDEVMRMAREKQGFSKNAIPIALNALAKSTQTSYTPHIKRWWDFSRRESCDTFDPKLCDVMEFLVECYSNGMTLSALQKARSALSYLISKDFGKNEFISVVYQGFANKKAN